MSGTSDAAAGGRIAESEQTGAEDAADMDEDDELERELERELAEEEANLEREIERELAKEEADAEAAERSYADRLNAIRNPLSQMPFHPPNRRTSRKPRTPEPGGEAAGGPRQDADDDEPAEAPDDAAAGRERDEAALRLQEAMRRKQEILKTLSPEELERYEVFRRSSLSKANMKKLLQSVTGQAPSADTTIVMCGVTKMFVGELIEAAKALAGREGESGPLRPSHIHAAFQQLSEQGRIPQRVSPRHRRL